MNANEKLDSVLRYLNKVYDTEMAHNGFPKDMLIYKSKSDINLGVAFKSADEDETRTILKYQIINDLDLVLDYLVEDGFVKNYENTFTILWKGKLLIENGGFKAIYEKGKRQKRTQTIKDFLLISGAWIASIAAVGLLYFEYVKLNHHNPYKMSFWVISIIVSCILVLVFMLILNLGDKEK